MTARTPATVGVEPYLWHRPDGTAEQCIAVKSVAGRRVIIPARQLRQIADALHDRADENEQNNHEEITTMTNAFTEQQYDKLMIRAMREERRARDAEATIDQHTARIGYLEHLLAIREEQLEQLRGEVKGASL